MKDFILVLHLQGDGWERRKNYWPKADGSPPQALLDQMTFWKPKPWVPTNKQSGVKMTVYRYVLESKVEIEAPNPVPIIIP